MPTVEVFVRDKTSNGIVINAPVTVNGELKGHTGKNGIARVRVDEGPSINFSTTVLGVTGTNTVTINPVDNPVVTLEPDLAGSLTLTDSSSATPPFITAGNVVNLAADLKAAKFTGTQKFTWKVGGGDIIDPKSKRRRKNQVQWDTTGATGATLYEVEITDELGDPDNDVSVFLQGEIYIQPGAISTRQQAPFQVSLQRTTTTPTLDQALWASIRTRTRAVSFSNMYLDFINRVLCEQDRTGLSGNARALARQTNELYTPIHGVGAYELLRTATQVFLLLNCGFSFHQEGGFYSDDLIFEEDEEGVRIGRQMTFDDLAARLSDYLGFGNGRLPYIQRLLDSAFSGFDPNGSVFCQGIIADRAGCPPLIELIWSYWMEEGMLVQTMNAISRRFRNRANGAPGRDPLSNMEIAPLYPLNNLLWGYVQDEHHRLSIDQRNYEYLHEYGLALRGKAVSDPQPADTRSKFLEAFHNLLYLATVYFRQSDDTTIVADDFPVYNALREVHLILAYGAHNQFGDLPWTARVEMLMQQWMLARPEMRRFLQSRDMVPYREPWMAQVDAMKSIQGWGDVTITHFQELATYGEQIVLSIRYGNWMADPLPNQAANWARYWRTEIQRYIHAYRAVTGLDLAAAATLTEQRQLVSTLPSILIQRRQQAPTALPAPSSAALPAAMVSPGFRQRRASRQS